MPARSASTSPARSLALIVDRDEDTRAMYVEYLVGLNRWTVEQAADGRDALALVVARRPAVIVTEARLPGIDGLELCALLKKDVLTASIPIAVVTAAAGAADLRRARSAGADAVLVKPCVPADLDMVLRQLLERNRAPRGTAPTTATGAQPPDRAADVFARRHNVGREPLSRAHYRGDTTSPPVAPPLLVCPMCDKPLAYARSHVGGVSERHPEQWDYFECPGGCGTFQYRQRTRRLRKVL